MKGFDSSGGKESDWRMISCGIGNAIPTISSRRRDLCR